MILGLVNSYLLRLNEIRSLRVNIVLFFTHVRSSSQPISLEAQKHVHDGLHTLHEVNDLIPVAGGVKRLEVLFLQGLDAVEDVLREAREGAGAVLAIVN